MLSDCYKTKTYQVLDAKIDQIWEPDYNPNERGFMSQQVALSDASGQHTVTVSTKFKDGFVKPEEQGQTHTWKIKCYDGQLSGFTTKPAVQGGYIPPSQAPQGEYNPPSQAPQSGYAPPSQAQQTQYNQATQPQRGETVKNLHPYNDPKTESIHRQCAMKAAVEILETHEPPTKDELRQDLVDWANFFVHYYRTGNSNQPDASITKKTDVDLSEPQTREDMGEPNF